ncbi:alpha/beta fold hydrolase [Nisaea sp.]|uniref:alpha/beta fold hydrolase n=1 Tax=Nisaea sp. TaxID=2024842 RepID=UPI003B524FB8
MRPDQGSFPFKDDHGTIWLAFTDWGGRALPRSLICAHGLTRQGRDFDAFARIVSRDIRCIEIDVAGRGRSGWLANKDGYNFETYLRHADGLLNYRGLTEVEWLGTSMGGIIGMLLAAREDGPIKRLILNDVGPFIPKAALERIGEYVKDPPVFENLNAAAAYLRETLTGFGDISDADWSEMTQHSVVREPDGTYRMHYDPAIGNAFDGPLEDVDLWAVYDAIECPTLVLRGADSDLLTRETAEEMTERGPKADLIEFEGCGHAPALMDEVQIAAVHEWLMQFEPVGDGDETEDGAAPDAS